MPLFALLTLCLSCSIARRTASSSEQSMIGFRPLPERVFNPSIPSDLKRFTQAFTLTWLISVCTPAAAEDSPSAFSNTARQRMRKQCFSPKRNPFSSARRSTSVNSNTFGFPIVYKTEKDSSLIQLTVDRLKPICPVENMWVVTNEKYIRIVKEQIP